ncbi:thioredoxin domain-containing protein [Actinomadura sp. NAK00032]|uniref:DsbA family protein n=1 Tax=Actinomadura sp. NAK00032 TaxID=2742128 RepID=UPI001591B7A9|nr:thioredoxin domain-containing protein [Actinomadura sp. NAK00032]QKW38212.1 thioredoxin domain-containing protein [Actinomadura sp. NAK00032]
MSASPRKTRSLTIAAVLLAAALALGLAAAFSTGGGEKPGAATSPSPSASPSRSASGPPDLARRKDGDPFALGRTDAPVVMVEYSDFQCPFCGRFARETKPRLIKKYVDAGVLRIEWRNFPIFGEESKAAAQAGYAAARQNRFWAFHDRLYAEPRRRNSGDFADKHLIAWAREAGVPDLGRFRADMKSGEAEDAMIADQVEGYRIGAASTPTFLINGRPLLGAQPFDVFVKAIEEARGQ